MAGPLLLQVPIAAAFSASSARKHLLVACFAPLAPGSEITNRRRCRHSDHSSRCTGPLFAVVDGDDEKAIEEEKTCIEKELESLQNQLALIEALEERNKSQLDSFVDEEDQWESLEEEERQLLLSKDSITKRMEILAEELVQIWMGAKSMDG